MEESRASSLTPAVVAAMLVGAMLLMYVGGYFWLGKALDVSHGVPGPTRIFKSRWQMYLFVPAGEVESAIRGRRVNVAYEVRE